MTGFGSLLTGHTLVGRYRIDSVIGRGGFAVVYEAHDERLDRLVAVKVITLAGPEGSLEKEMQARFQREARASAGLQHRNVVSIFDFGNDPALGLDFLVMERLRGEDLRTRLRRADAMPLAGALHILGSAAAGVAAGHQVGIIHRDVKPANIFLTVSPEVQHFRVCVLDFGIAFLAAADDTTRITRNGIPLSVPYASPEQLEGIDDLTPASDVFGLGVVAYETLGRKRPFSGDALLALEERATPPQPVRELNPEIPEHVAAAIERALRVDPAERFPDARAFERALLAPEAVVRPVVASAPPAVDRPVREALPAAAAGDLPRPADPPVPSPRSVSHPAGGVESAVRADGTRDGSRSMMPMAALAALLVAVGAGGFMLLGGSDDDPSAIATSTADGSPSTDSGTPGEAVSTQPVGDSMVAAPTTSAGAPLPTQRPMTSDDALATSRRPAAAQPGTATPATARQNPGAEAANAPTFVRRTAPPPASAPAQGSAGSIPAPSGAEFRENLSHRCQSLASDAEASACLQRDMAAADSELNSVYQSVLSRLDPQRRDALRESQRAWLLRYDRVITSYYSTPWGDHSRVEVLPSQIQALRDRAAYLRRLADGG